MNGARALACTALLALSACASPRADRDWYPYLAPTAHATADAERFAVRPVSDWSYAGAGPTAETYTEASFTYADLRTVWFVLEPQPGSKLAAHTFLMFEFTGDRLLGLTIEARREADEKYSAVRGAFNAYELSYLWASARDLLTRRAVMLEHDVFIYPVAIDAAQREQLLRNVLARTAELEANPRYYNTLFSNCTNELAKAAGLRWNYAWVLTGASDNYLFREGLIPGDDFPTAEAAAKRTDLVRALNNAPARDFDRLLLQALRS